MVVCSTESNFGQVVDIGVPAEAMNAAGIDYEKRQVSGAVLRCLNWLGLPYV